MWRENKIVGNNFPNSNVWCRYTTLSVSIKKGLLFKIDILRILFRNLEQYDSS